MRGIELVQWDWMRIADAVQEIEDGEVISGQSYTGSRWSVEVGQSETVLIAVRAGERE